VPIIDEALYVYQFDIACVSLSSNLIEYNAIFTNTDMELFFVILKEIDKII